MITNITVLLSLSYFVFDLLSVSLSLSQAFIAVEKSFFESIDHIFAEKTTIQLQLPEVTTMCAIKPLPISPSLVEIGLG